VVSFGRFVDDWIYRYNVLIKFNAKIVGIKVLTYDGSVLLNSHSRLAAHDVNNEVDILTRMIS